MLQHPDPKTRVIQVEILGIKFLLSHCGTCFVIPGSAKNANSCIEDDSYKKENECDFIKLIEILTFSIVQVVMLKYFLALGQRSKYHLEIFRN